MAEPLKQYKNDANWLQRNVTRPLRSLIQPLYGKRDAKQRIAQDYGDTGRRDQNVFRYAPWQTDRNVLRQKYYIPNAWYNSNGGIKKQFANAYRQKFKRWQADAKANGYDSDPRYWMLMAQTPAQKNRIQQKVNQSKDILPIALAQHRELGIPAQVKKLKFAIKNAPSQARRRQLYNQLLRLGQANQQLKRRYNNLSTWDKARLKIGQASSAVAAPGALHMAGTGLPFMATLGATSPLARAGARYFYKDQTAIAKAFATGQFDKLTPAQKTLMKNYATELKLPARYQDDPVAFHQAAAELMRRRQNSAQYADKAKDFLTMLAPTGIVKNVGKASVKQLAANAGRQAMRKAPTAAFWSFGLPGFKGGGSGQLPAEVAAVTPGYNGGIESNNSLAWDMFNQGLLGIPQMTRSWFKDTTAQYREPQVTAEALQIARKQLPPGASAQDIILQAKRNMFNTSVQQQRRKLTIQDRQSRSADIIAQGKQMAQQIAATQQLPQSQRVKVLNRLLQGKQMSAKAVAYLVDGVDDPNVANQMADAFTANPYIGAQILKKLKDGKSTSVSGQATTAAFAKLAPVFLQKTLDKYSSGLKNATDKFQFIKSYMPLFYQMKSLQGAGGQSGEQAAKMIQDITSKAVWDEVKKNPLAINKAMSIWAMSHGFDSLAGFLNNSGAFYGTLVGLPLTIMLMKSLFGGSKQPAPVVQQVPVQGYQPLAYAPKADITRMSPIVG